MQTITGLIIVLVLFSTYVCFSILTRPLCTWPIAMKTQLSITTLATMKRKPPQVEVRKAGGMRYNVQFANNYSKV